MKKTDPSPRFELRWAKSRRGPWKVICWCPSNYRASMIAYQFEWTGWFRIDDLAMGQQGDAFRT